MEAKAKTRKPARRLANVATLLAGKAPVLSLTQDEDAKTFGWRTVGQVEIKGRSGKTRRSQESRGGFASVHEAIADGMVFLARVGAVAGGEYAVVDYVPPTRAPAARRDQKALADALAVAKSLALPSAVARPTRAKKAS